MGHDVKEVLDTVGLGGSSLDRVRLAQGVVGKSSYVAAIALGALSVVAFSLRDTGSLFAVGCLIAGLFLVYFGGVLWFANRHPDISLLEGAELLKLRQIEMAAKGLTSPPQDSAPKVIGGGES